MVDPSLLPDFGPEWGWIGVLVYLWVEIRSPWGRIQSLLDQIERVITVVRALARIHGDEGEINVKKVDRYLVEDESEPGDFIMASTTDTDPSPQTVPDFGQPDADEVEQGNPEEDE